MVIDPPVRWRELVQKEKATKDKVGERKEGGRRKGSSIVNMRIVGAVNRSVDANTIIPSNKLASGRGEVEKTHPPETQSQVVRVHPTE